MNMIIDFVSAISIYIVPYLLGRTLVRQMKHDVSPVATFSIGALVLYFGVLLGSAVLQSLQLHITEQMLRTAGLLFSGLLVLLNLDLLSIVTRMTKATGLMALVGVLAFAIWSFNIPYPLTVNWDVFEHQTLINSMLGGTLSFQTSQISDTFGFDGYSTLFHTLLAVPQFLFQPNPLGFWWLAQLIHFGITLTATYVLAKTITRNANVALLSTIISAFVFESYSVFSSFFLMPQTMVASIAVLSLRDMLQNANALKYSQWVAVIAFILLAHYIIGTAAVLLLLATWVIQKWHIAHTSRFVGGSIAAIIAIYLATMLLGSVLPLQNINNGEAASFTFSMPKMIEFFRVFYGGTFFILFPLGVFAAVRSKLVSEKLLVVLALLTLVIVVSPLPYAIKFYVLGRYLAHIVMGLGAWYIIGNLSLTGQRVAILAFVLLFGSILTLNASYWKYDLMHQRVATEVSQDEIAAAQYLKDTYKKDSGVLLLSDPATQNVLEPLSGINSAGGVYMTIPNRKLLHTILVDTNAETVSGNMAQIQDRIITIKPTRYIIALSGRSYQWAHAPIENRENLGFSIWAPKNLTLYNEQAIAAFPIGTLVYKNPSVALIEVIL